MEADMNRRQLFPKNFMKKSLVVYSMLALFLVTTGSNAFAEDKNEKGREKSKQTVENIVNYNTVKSSDTGTSGSGTDKAKPGDSAADFKSKQTLKTKEVPNPVKIPETKPVEKSTDTIKSPPQDKPKDKKSSLEVDPMCLMAKAGSVEFGEYCIEKD
jgi:hypothetical protein